MEKGSERNRGLEFVVTLRVLDLDFPMADSLFPVT